MKAELHNFLIIAINSIIHVFLVIKLMMGDVCMKFRVGFISNSSSMSFVFAVKGSMLDALNSAIKDEESAKAVARGSNEYTDDYKDLLKTDLERYSPTQESLEKHQKEWDSLISLLEKGYEVYKYTVEKQEWETDLGWNTLIWVFDRAKDVEDMVYIGFQD